MNGAEIDVYFADPNNTGSLFQGIYDNIKDWANSFHIVSHPDWEENVKVRFGDIEMISQPKVNEKWDYYSADSEPAHCDELGNNRYIMFGGYWPTVEQNLWSGCHIGRVNANRCANGTVARKYFWHELGHAHGLPDDEENSGNLMAPNDWIGMRLSADQCSTWSAAYDEASCESSSQSVSIAEVDTDAGPGKDAEIEGSNEPVESEGTVS